MTRDDCCRPVGTIGHDRARSLTLKHDRVARPPPFDTSQHRVPSSDRCTTESYRYAAGLRCAHGLVSALNDR